MRKVSELSNILKDQLGWHKARVDFFARALLALLMCKIINFKELAYALPSATAGIDSRYRRIQRFFASFEINFTLIARWIFNLFISPDQKFYVSIDRTNWYFGKAKINIFMLSICYEGIAIPIIWKLLDKAGNSSAEEQIELVQRFIDIFGSTQIESLFEDREFPNEAFLAWLIKHKIPFNMRVKKDAWCCIRQHRFKQTGDLFASLNSSEQSYYPMTVWIYGTKVFLAASRNEKGELMLVISNDNPKCPIARYLRRWEVETLFHALKGRGFKLEETHVTALERLDKIVAFLAIGFAWAHKVGEFKAKIKPILLKRFKNQIRPQYSFFRYGLDCLRDNLIQPKQQLVLFKNLVKLLQCPILRIIS